MKRTSRFESVTSRWKLNYNYTIPARAILWRSPLSYRRQRYGWDSRSALVSLLFCQYNKNPVLTSRFNLIIKLLKYYLNSIVLFQTLNINNENWYPVTDFCFFGRATLFSKIFDNISPDILFNFFIFFLILLTRMCLRIVLLLQKAPHYIMV